MIRGVHTMFYSSKAEELRAFIRDKLQFPHTDVGEGWLIFDVPRPTWDATRPTRPTVHHRACMTSLSIATTS